jgi:nucleoside-diphosphate-sugar epimerase
MRVLVTGGFGNVGSSVVRSLLDAGHDVRAFDVRNRVTEQRARAFGTRGLETTWGDVTDGDAVARAIDGCDALVHLAFVIPPLTDVDPVRSEAVNLGGTRTVIEAARRQSVPPSMLFISTFDVFGRTQSQPPPRRVDDPISATNAYTAQKIACEELVRTSGLEWRIIRLADVPIIGFRKPHPIMFEIPLANRFEVLHTLDAGLAIGNAVTCEEAKGRVLLVGGGPKCQVTYRDFLFGMLDVMGIGPLPERAFGSTEWPSDWIDTDESERLLQYQRHTFDDIIDEVRRLVAYRRYAIRTVRPIAKWFILRTSPYMR